MMIYRKKWYSDVALVAGASEGIGAAFARELAAKGMELVLVARGLEKLTALATEIEETQKVKCHIFQCDLGDAVGADAISCFLADNSLEVDILVYNAAVSPIGPYLEMEKSEIDRAVQVNITTQSKLLHSLSGRMAERGRGAEESHSMLQPRPLAGYWPRVCGMSGGAGVWMLSPVVPVPQLRPII